MVRGGVDGRLVSFALQLPYPPSNNRYYRHFRGRTVISAEGLTYRQEVLAARPRTGWPMKGDLGVLVEIFPERARSLDLDNVPKCLLDSLQHAKFFDNDFQVVDLHIRRCAKVKSAFIRVWITEKW